MHHKQYTPHGSRGKPVKHLKANNVTEDERFIFEYLNAKRERLAALGAGKHDPEADIVDDDEFDAYLDSLGGKRKKGDDGIDDEEFDLIGDFGDGKKMEDDENGDWDDEDDDDDDDGDDDDVNDEEGPKSNKMMNVDDEFSDSDGSISLDGDDDDEPDIFEDSDDDDDVEDGDGDELSDVDVSDPEDDEPKAKRMKPVSNKDFQKKLKHTSNMNSLFAAAEDFSEMLEETSKTNNHGTLGEIFNQDKSSEKQLQWESKRLKQTGKFSRKPNKKRNRSQGQKRRGETSNKKQIGGKRKHK